ncbi:MAG: S8 family serine peptidase [Planctomycetota bacterium]|nr:S8 family serine peptidase [Planctomycetota bacterium]
MHFTQRAALFSVPFFVTTFASCGGGGSGDDSTNASGAILFVAASPMMAGDIEPNDSVDRPQPIGDVQIGRELRIRGTVGEGDELDAFAFTARERTSITAELVFDTAPGRVVQLVVFDPLAMRVAGRADTNGLRFDARGAFDLVVRADVGNGPYTLVVKNQPTAERALVGGFIGALSIADSFTLGGTSRWSATSAESAVVVVAGVTAGSVRVKNVTTGEEITCSSAESHIAVGLFETLEFSGENAALVAVRVEAPARTSARRGFTRQAAIVDERTAWNVDAGARAYGEPMLESAAGEVLVRAKDGAELSSDYASRSCVVKDVLPGIADLVHVELPEHLSTLDRARATVALARSFAISPRVEYAELNLIRRAQGGPVTPNDTYYGLQWHYPLIKLPQAWGVFTGTTNTIVAVIDTGERPHPDLDANTITGFDFISSATIAGDGDGRDADPFDEGDGTGPTPSSFHGTHVAGTIAAVTGNSVGVSGVCGPQNRTRVMHLRALGQGGGTDADIAQAILYAARLTNASGTLPAQRADVINMSLGGPGSTSSVQSAINSAVGAGVVIFAASGNNNSGTAFFPASYNNVISVSAVDINSEKAPYSNFNATVDVCAPGGDTSIDLNNDTYADGVLSTLVNEQTSAPVFAFYQGTSMACPHAAGLAALMRSQNTALTPAQVESLMKSTSVDLGAIGQDPIYGTGLIDSYQALVASGAGTIGGTPALSVSPSTLSFGATTTELSFQINNVGGGTLDVGAINFSAPWLTLVEVPSSGGLTDIGSVRCLVDRTGLAAGTYSVTVTVNANNGTVASAIVGVSMTVVPAPVIVNVDLYVLAVNADTFETVAQIVVNPASGLSYSFVDLPAGNYILVCGSDEDLTDGICGPNDVYCGVYPTVNRPEIIPFAGGDIAGLDFVVGPTESGPASAGSHRVYALRN